MTCWSESGSWKPGSSQPHPQSQIQHHHPSHRWARNNLRHSICRMPHPTIGTRSTASSSEGSENLTTKFSTSASQNWEPMDSSPARRETSTPATLDYSSLQDSPPK